MIPSARSQVSTTTGFPGCSPIVSKPEIGGVGPPAGRDEDLVGVEHAAIGKRGRDGRVLGSALHRGQPRAGDDGDAFSGERGGDLLPANGSSRASSRDEPSTIVTSCCRAGRMPAPAPPRPHRRRAPASDPALPWRPWRCGCPTAALPASPAPVGSRGRSGREDHGPGRGQPRLAGLGGDDDGALAAQPALAAHEE